MSVKDIRHRIDEIDTMLSAEDTTNYTEALSEAISLANTLKSFHFPLR